MFFQRMLRASSIFCFHFVQTPNRRGAAMKTVPIFRCDYNSHFATFTQIVVYSKRPCGKFSSAQHFAISAGCVLFVRNFILWLPLKNTHSTNARSFTHIHTHTHVYSGYFHTDEFSHLINCLADESERQVKAAVCLRCGSSITIISLTKRRKLYASSGGLRRRRREKQAAGHRQPSEKRRNRAERATLCVLYPRSDWPPAKQINLPLKWANQLKHANSAPHFYLVSSSSTLVYINLIWPALKRNLMLVRKQRGFIFGWHTNYL